MNFIKHITKKIKTAVQKESLNIHFFLSSLGLFGLIRLLAVIFSQHLTINFELYEYALPFFNNYKISENLRYLLSVPLLFIYFVFFKKYLFKYFKEVNIFNLLIDSAVGLVLIYVYYAQQSNWIILFFGTGLWIFALILPILKVKKIIFFSREFLIKNHWFFSVAFIVIFIVNIFSLINFFKPFLFEDIKIKNEYLDIPEQTIINNQYVDNISYINKNNIFGLHDIYDLRKDFGNNPFNKNCFFINDLNEKLKNYISLNKNNYYYDYVNKRVCVIDKITELDKNILPSYIDSSKTINDIYTNNLVDNFNYSNKKYSTDVESFIVNNHFELQQIIYDSVPVIHHLNHLLTPINELRLGKNIKDINFQYGFLGSYIFKKIFDITGNFNFQNFFRVNYYIYFIYYFLFLLLTLSIFKKKVFSVISSLLIVASLYMFGYFQILVGIANNPIRHILDIFIIYFFFLYLKKDNFIFMILALLFSIISSYNDSFFAIAIFLSLSIVYFLKFIENNKLNFKSLLIFLLILLNLICLTKLKVNINSNSSYFFFGLLGGKIPPKAFFLILIIYSTIYTFLTRKIKSKTNLYMSWFLFLYSQFILFYWIAEAEIGHLLSIAPILFFTAIFIVYTLYEEYKNIIAKIDGIIFTGLIFCSIIYQLNGYYSYYSFASDKRLLNNTHYEFYPSIKEYNRIFDTHKIYNWNFDIAKFKSTMNPLYFEESVKLIKKYEKENFLYIISKYDNLLPFLSNKYSAMPYIELNSYIVTNKEFNNTVGVLIKDKPKYLFADTDISRSLLYDTINVKVKYFGYLSNRSIIRSQRLDILNKVFSKIKKYYKPIEKGYLITVYERI